MSPKTPVFLACALAVTGCAEGWDLPADGDGSPFPGADSPRPHLDAGTDEPEIPEGWPAETPPDSRIQSLLEVDGDWIVTATVSDEVSDRYPDAEHYAIRLSPSRRSTLISLVANDGGTRELLRTTFGSTQLVPDAAFGAQLCFPLPALPPTVGDCSVDPCPWDAFPTPDGSPENCVEVGRIAGADQTQIRGQVGSIPVSVDVTETADGSDVSGLDTIELDESALDRLTDVSVVLNDVDFVLAELEPMQVNCFKCWILEDLAALGAADCVLGNVFACAGAAFALDAADTECNEEKCE